MATEKLTGLTIDLDIDQIKKLIDAMPEFEEDIIKAVKPSLQRAANHVRTRISQEVPKRYYVKSGDVKKTLRDAKYSNGMIWAIESRGYRLPLVRFPHKPGSYQSYKRAKPKPNIEVKYKKPDGYKPILKRAFIAPASIVGSTKAQPYNIFRRTGPARLPIVPMTGGAIPHMIRNADVVKAIQKSANEMLTQRLDHEIIRNFKKIEGRIK